MSENHDVLLEVVKESAEADFNLVGEWLPDGSLVLRRK